MPRWAVGRPGPGPTGRSSFDTIKLSSTRPSAGTLAGKRQKPNLSPHLQRGEGAVILQNLKKERTGNQGKSKDTVGSRGPMEPEPSAQPVSSPPPLCCPLAVPALRWRFPHSARLSPCGSKHGGAQLPGLRPQLHHMCCNLLSKQAGQKRLLREPPADCERTQEVVAGQAGSALPAPARLSGFCSTQFRRPNSSIPWT